MKHLTPEEIERFAGGEWPPSETSPHRGSDERARHLDECADCREGVEAVRALDRCLAELPGVEPARGLADAVMAAVDLPAPWLDEAIAGLPQVAPSAGFTAAVMRHVALPAPWLDAALERLPQPVPAPGFAISVMSRVRLPIPWHQRLARFARRRRTALVGATAATVAVSGIGAGWLFGVQGVTPLQLVTFVLGGVQDLAVRGLVALGGIGYELGLVEAGSAITDITPTAAFGSLALLSAVGLLSLLVMARLMRVGPELRLSEST